MKLASISKFLDPFIYYISKMPLVTHCKISSCNMNTSSRSFLQMWIIKFIVFLFATSMIYSHAIGALKNVGHGPSRNQVKILRLGQIIQIIQIRLDNFPSTLSGCNLVLLNSIGSIPVNRLQNRDTCQWEIFQKILSDIDKMNDLSCRCTMFRFFVSSKQTPQAVSCQAGANEKFSFAFLRIGNSLH